VALSRPARATTRRIRIRRRRAGGALVAIVAIAVALGFKSLVSSSTVSSSSTVPSPSTAAARVNRSRNEQRNALGEAGGALPSATTVFDQELPGVADLDPALLRALRRGPARVAQWLSAHGAAYGLCQIYGNGPWHFELRATAIAGGCPPTYADPPQDPRMEQ
jgi:hypothetical protein